MLRLLREVVTEPMFLLLVACGAIYMLLGDRHEAFMLLGFVFVVMGISFVQQRRAERSLDALRDLSSPRALVVRDGQPQRIAGRELVVGDVVLLAEGDRVPGDMRLVEASNLTIDESLLTGESAPVMKQAGTEAAPADDTSAPPEGADATWAFSGTLVTQGTARGCVMATGARSALGRIGQSLAGIPSEQTPIQLETKRIVKRVAAVGLLLALGLAIAWWLARGDWLHGLLAGLTLAMAVLPEELPVVLTLFLGLGAWRLAREKVLARSIPAVELLGATTVLCVDKTGTLTANRMAVRSAVVGVGRLRQPAGRRRAAAGGAARAARVCGAGQPPPRLRPDGDGHRRGRAAPAGRHRAPARRLEPGRGLSAVGRDAGHVARLAVARPARTPDLREGRAGGHRRPVPPRRGAACGHCRTGRGAGWRRACACSVSRVPASTRRRLPGNQHDFDFEFLGLLALEDPVRPEVPQAIAECRAAGIRVVMMTGDHPATALSVARQVGLGGDGAVISGAELAALDDEAAAARAWPTRRSSAACSPSRSCAWCAPSARAATWWR